MGSHRSEQKGLSFRLGQGFKRKFPLEPLGQARGRPDRINLLPVAQNAHFARG
jgi:hypothetical protein